MKYRLDIDPGTTGLKAVVLDELGKLLGKTHIASHYMSFAGVVMFRRKGRGAGTAYVL